MKQTIKEYTNGSKVAKLVVDDVGMTSVQCFENERFSCEISVLNTKEYSSLEDFAQKWVMGEV